MRHHRFRALWALDVVLTQDRLVERLDDGDPR